MGVGDMGKGSMGKGSVRTTGGCWLQTSCLNPLSFSGGIIYVYCIRYIARQHIHYEQTIVIPRQLPQNPLASTLWVVCYLKGTQTMSPELEGLLIISSPFVNWVLWLWLCKWPDTEGHHSVAGYCFTLDSEMVSWSSKKQKTIADLKSFNMCFRVYGSFWNRLRKFGYGHYFRNSDLNHSTLLPSFATTQLPCFVQAVTRLFTIGQNILMWNTIECESDLKMKS